MEDSRERGQDILSDRPDLREHVAGTHADVEDFYAGIGEWLHLFDTGLRIAEYGPPPDRILRHGHGGHRQDRAPARLRHPLAARHLPTGWFKRITRAKVPEPKRYRLVMLPPRVKN